MRILFDKNVPVGVRTFLSGHEVHTFIDMQWHLQLENGALLDAAEAANFDLMVTADQNIEYQQNLVGRKLALVVLGSNIWPIVRQHRPLIAAHVNASTPGSFDFLEMRLPPKRRKAVPLPPPQ